MRRFQVAIEAGRWRAIDGPQLGTICEIDTENYSVLNPCQHAGTTSAEVIWSKKRRFSQKIFIRLVSDVRYTMTDQWAIFVGRIGGGGNVDCLHKSLIEEGIRMIQNRLRLYCGPDASGTASVAETKQTPKNVTLPAGEVFAWLADAAQNSRAWLRDFEDDQITISSDLYEVILAYQHFRRPSA